MEQVKYICPFMLANICHMLVASEPPICTDLSPNFSIKPKISDSGKILQKRHATNFLRVASRELKFTKKSQLFSVIASGLPGKMASIV